MITRALALLALVAATLTLAAAPATAAPVADSKAAAEAEVQRLLTEVDGAVRVDATTVKTPLGTFTVYDGTNARSIATCATGYYCAWRGAGYTGTRLDLIGCSASGTSSSLAGLGGPARSVANARLSGTVQLRNGATVVATLGAGSGNGAWTSTITAMVCFT